MGLMGKAKERSHTRTRDNLDRIKELYPSPNQGLTPIYYTPQPTFLAVPAKLDPWAYEI
jgi:hypothetical protein